MITAIIIVGSLLLPIFSQTIILRFVEKTRYFLSKDFYTFILQDLTIDTLKTVESSFLYTCYVFNSEKAKFFIKEWKLPTFCLVFRTIEVHDLNNYNTARYQISIKFRAFHKRMKMIKKYLKNKKKQNRFKILQTIYDTK